MISRKILSIRFTPPPNAEDEFEFDIPVMVTIPKVEFNELLEKDNICNKVPNAKPTTPNRLFVAVETSDKAELKIKTTITPSVTGIGSHIVWGVLDSANLLPESGTLQDNGEADVIFKPTGPVGAKIYTVRVGCDKNGDGKLQKDEIIETPKPPANPFTVIVVRDSDYIKSRTFLERQRDQGLANLVPLAKTFLNLFLTQAVAPLAPSSTANATVSVADPNPTHIAGAPYNPVNCTAPVTLYQFADGSEASDIVENGGLLANGCLTKVINTLLESKKQTIQQHFTDNPTDNSESFSFPLIAQGVDFRTSSGRDLPRAIGQADLAAGSVSILVVREKKKLVIQTLRIRTSVMDLYDFDFERAATSLSRQGATVEIGWQPPVRTAGKIFKNEIEIDRIVPDYKFNLN